MTVSEPPTRLPPAHAADVRKPVRALVPPIPTWLALALLGLSIYLLTLPADLRNNADTVDRFFVTRSLVHFGQAWVACPGPHAPPPADARLAVGRHGCVYAIYGPGQSVLMAPLYVAGDVIGKATQSSGDFVTALAVRALDPILGALILAVFFLLARLIGYRRRTAVVLTLVLGFASTLWPDVQSGQELTATTLALLVAAYFALARARVPKSDQVSRFRAATGSQVSGPHLRPRSANVSATAPQGEGHGFGGSIHLPYWLTDDRAAMLCGAAAGFGFFMRYDFLVPTMVLAGYLGWQARGERAVMGALGAFALGFLPFFIGVAGWDLWRYGRPWQVGESAAVQFGHPIWQGVGDLLVSPGKGLLWYLPLVWIVPLAARPFWRRHRDACVLCAALVIAFVLFYANVSYWHGDPAWGPRYLFPVVPFLVLTLGVLLDRWPVLGLGPRTCLVGSLLLSLAVQMVAVSVDPWHFWHDLIRDRQQAGQTFVWGPNNYHYYWDVAHSPLRDQFIVAGDVVAIALGNRSAFVPESPACHTPRQTPLQGSTCRPINTVSPIWLNGRYEWLVALPVPLSLAARIAIVTLLVLLGLFAARSLVRRAQPLAAPGDAHAPGP